MLVYKLTIDENEVFVLLDSQTPHQYARIEYRGDTAAVDRAREWLTWEHGAYGHLIGESGRVTPIDLSAAMNSERAKAFLPKRVSGGELVQEYNPGIPDNAKT